MKWVDHCLVNHPIGLGGDGVFFNLIMFVFVMDLHGVVSFLLVGGAVLPPPVGMVVYYAFNLYSSQLSFTMSRSPYLLISILW